VVIVGIDLKQKKVYVCEVAIHLTTGLQYVKDKRPNNINKLTDKFSRDIEYANKYFNDYVKHFMLWSPVVKSTGRQEYNQKKHIEEIDQNIKANFGVSIEFIVNDHFSECLNEMRVFAKSTTAEIKCPVMRFLQIEEHLAKHLSR
jgi:hypothetical protein